jgi:hypothetical protein
LRAISWTEFDINSALAAMLSHQQLQKTTRFGRSKGGFIKKGVRTSAVLVDCTAKEDLGFICGLGSI